MSKLENIRVVWNLTNKCPFNCPICVASANTRVENIDKMKILNSILSFPNTNLSIDFSGGDPLFMKEDIDLIKYTSNILGKDNISISSTGLSLSRLDDNEILSLCNNYDMTYDFPKKYCDEDFRGKIYNTLNYDQCIRLKKLNCNIDIFIPIRDIESKYYEELARDISLINPNKVNLLKCMPLNGKMKKDIVDNKKNVQLFLSFLEKYNFKGETSINCALKEDFNEKNGCNMLTEQKIGLDQFGNVFTCIWASDLLINTEDNPFYLGNLLDTNLFNLINEAKIKSYQDTINNNRNKCYVLEHFYNN